MSWVFRHSPYEGTARLIHLAIADIVNDAYENRLFAGDAVLRDKAKCSQSTLSRAKARMIADGYLEVVDGSTAPGRTTEYRFLMPAPTVVKMTSVDGGQSDANGGQSDANGGQSDANGGHLRHAPLLPTQGTQGNTSDAEITTIDPIVADPLVGFDAFWSTYPKRNGKRLGRGLCETRWRRYDLDTRRAAYRGAKYYGEAVDRGLTIAKDPDRWLRDKCWQDWQDPAVADTNRDPLRRGNQDSLADLLKQATGG